jgi:hypothetical protein
MGLLIITLILPVITLGTELSMLLCIFIYGFFYRHENGLIIKKKYSYGSKFSGFTKEKHKFQFG